MKNESLRIIRNQIPEGERTPLWEYFEFRKAVAAQFAKERNQTLRQLLREAGRDKILFNLLQTKLDETVGIQDDYIKDAQKKKEAKLNTKYEKWKAAQDQEKKQ